MRPSTLLIVAALLSPASCSNTAVAQAAQGRRATTVALSFDSTLNYALSHRQLGVWDKREPLLPFVISASGGISLGAYQAGVTWSLLRFMRRLEVDTAFTRDTLGIGFPRLWAATGASAGNINALLSAVEWCTPEPTAPEESLLWKVWISVGWPELFPDHRSGNLPKPDSGSREQQSLLQGDAAIFDRAFFKDHLFPLIVRRMDGATRAQCDGLPIGVTTTRVEPVSFMVTPQLRALTQRYASIFELRDNPSGNGVVFSQARSGLRDRGMGALLVPAVGATSVLPPTDVFTLVEASSAFPMAFSPRLLKYYEAGQLRENGWCPPADSDAVACAVPQRAFFTDGGVFDNNPLQLALDIYERTTNVVRVTAPGTGERVTQFAVTPARALYVGTDLFRNEKLRRRLTTDPTPAPIGGINAVVSLLGGAVPAARQYEMQTLARSLARDSVMPQKYIRTTDRYYPLFGAHIGAFGAFLGRPLREWDFYAGMYDGLHFAAADVICSDSGFQLARFPGVDRHRRCVDAWMGRLVGARVVPLGPLAPFVLADLLAFETNGQMQHAVLPSHLTTTDAERLQVLRRLSRAQADHIDRPRPTCTSKDWARRFVCGGNLDPLIADIRSDDSVMALFSSWSKQKACVDPKDPLNDPCLADATFVSFARSPSSELKHRVGHVANRMWGVERAVRQDNANRRSGQNVGTNRARGASEYSAWVEVGEMLLRSYDWPARHGWDVDPSSIPPEGADWRKRTMAQLFPYHLSGGIRGAGYDAGFLPLWHVGEHLAIQFPVSFARTRDAIHRSDSVPASQVQPGLGVVFKPGGLLLQGVGAAVRPTVALVRSGKSAWVPLREDMLSYELSGLLLAGKLRLSVYNIPRGFASSRRIGARAGLSDIPGILYWIWR